MQSIKDVLMERDGMTSIEAEDLLEQAKEAYFDYIDEENDDAAENICEEYFNLEQDYLDDLFS